MHNIDQIMSIYTNSTIDSSKMYGGLEALNKDMWSFMVQIGFRDGTSSVVNPDETTVDGKINRKLFLRTKTSYKI